MSADFDYFQRIPYETYVQKRDNTDGRIKLDDLEHGMIVDAYSVNRHLGREDAAVTFMAELRLNDRVTSHLGAVSLTLAIYSHRTLQPILDAEFPVKAYLAAPEDDNAPLLWQMTGRFPLRTARYGIIQTGFFSYWADSILSDLNQPPESPQKENRQATSVVTGVNTHPLVKGRYLCFTP